MSGHNKWSKIKHKKAATDAKKSKGFSNFSRLITMEAKQAGGNLESPGLKLAILRARKINVPNDNIDRAIKKATESGGVADEQIFYELYGPGGTAIMIDMLTDNRNRTAAELKHLLSKRELELAKPGASAWAFEKKDGEWQAKAPVSISVSDKEKLDELIDALLEHDDVTAVYTNISE